jgi:uncharacterized membrane protein YbhN (UPF0104 family)
MKKIFSPLGMSIVTLAAALAALFSIPLLLPTLSFEGERITSFWPIGAALFLFLVQEALNPIFAGLALRSVGESTRYRTQLLIILLSTSANSAVPFPAGIPIRAVLQKQFFQIPLAKSAGAMLIETLVGYGIVAACAFVSGYLWFRVAFEQQLRDLRGSSIALVALAGSLLAVCVFWIVFSKKKKLQGSVMEAGRQAAQARIMPLGGMAVVVLASMLLALIRFELILQAIGIEASYGPLLGALLISRLAGVVSLVPMGLGIRDASLVSMLIMLGVSAPHAIAAAAIDRIIMTVPNLVGGFIATHLLGRQVVESVLRPAAGGALSGPDS